MTPIELLTKLSKAKTITGVCRLLSSIEADNPFWSGIYHGIQPYPLYTISFSLVDPVSYGDGAGFTVLPKLIEGIYSGTINENQIIPILIKLTKKCTKEEWDKWYNPILSKTLIPPFTVTQFNEYAPAEFKIKPIYFSQLTKINEYAHRMPTNIVIEAYPNAPRVFILLSANGVRAFSEDGTPIITESIEKVFNFRPHSNILLEAYHENGVFILRDIISIDDLQNGKDLPNITERLSSLADKFPGDNSVIQVIEYTKAENIREDITVFFECGYPGVVLRDMGLHHAKKGANLVIHPTIKNTLKCTDIKVGKYEYENRVEYLFGSGVKGKIKFTTPVFHGITSTERVDLRKSDKIGERFKVRSCGLDDNKHLIFPVFGGWKT